MGQMSLFLFKGMKCVFMKPNIKYVNETEEPKNKTKCDYIGWSVCRAVILWTLDNPFNWWLSEIK